MFTGYELRGGPGYCTSPHWFICSGNNLGGEILGTASVANKDDDSPRSAHSLFALTGQNNVRNGESLLLGSDFQYGGKNDARGCQV